MIKIKTFDAFVDEKLNISDVYLNKKMFPKNTNELRKLLDELIEERGEYGNFNDINTSNITDMSYLFSEWPDFNGNISQWNTSKVENMASMFEACINFNRNISGWDTKNVTNMNRMFFNAKMFKQNLSNWNVKKVKDHMFAFYGSMIEDKPIYLPRFKK